MTLDNRHLAVPHCAIVYLSGTLVATGSEEIHNIMVLIQTFESPFYWAYSLAANFSSRFQLGTLKNALEMC